MTTEQLDAILSANSDGKKWQSFFNGQNKAGAAISSTLSGVDMRSGYYLRENGARTGTIMLWAINNVEIESSWFVAWQGRNEAIEKQKKQSIFNL